MGCLSAKVTFLSTPPTAEGVVAALCHHTGEVVSYNEELVCSASGDAFPAFASTTDGPMWRMLTINLSGGYLWYASLAALQTLGGTYAGALPAWAYKPWVEARHEYEQEAYKAPRYTYAEARRLGIVK
jgi:hypothetical protein